MGRWKAFTEPFSREEQEFHDRLVLAGFDPMDANQFLREVFDYSERYVWLNEEE